MVPGHAPGLLLDEWAGPYLKELECLPCFCLALEAVERELTGAFLQHIEEGKDISLCILQSFRQPTGLLWQGGPLLWIHPKISAAKSVDYYPTSMASLAT